MGEKLLTVREVSSILKISEKEVLDLAETGAIPAYKVGGVYVRFKYEQVEDYRKKHKKPLKKEEKVSAKDAVVDFLYYNDFYILASVLIIIIIFIILKK
jgi:excisionase family DNA binding protein